MTKVWTQKVLSEVSCTSSKQSLFEALTFVLPLSAPPATKKQKRSDSEDSNENESPDLAPRRGTRTRARITYEEISSDEDDGDAHEKEEEEAVPARSSKKKADSGDSSEFSEAEEDDDESDFEEA